MDLSNWNGWHTVLAVDAAVGATAGYLAAHASVFGSEASTMSNVSAAVVVVSAAVALGIGTLTASASAATNRQAVRDAGDTVIRAGTPAAEAAQITTKRGDS